MRLVSCILFTLLLSCEKKPVSKIDGLDTEQAWSHLTSTDGCLVGQQDSIGRLGEGTCLAEPEWQDFINSPTDSRITYLCGKLGSGKETSIHTCPYQLATEGELSLYALQHLTKKPWRAYNGGNERLKKFIDTWKVPKGKAAFMGEQDMIWEMLEDNEFRESLIAYYGKS